LKVAATVALVIASPEYTHGIAGTVKNAIDWWVSLDAIESGTWLCP
jgi:NAD(P)H-dependent FMN reductase